jgi:alkylhydroperoxidase family enzyme
LQKAGATDAQLVALDDPDRAVNSELFDELQRAVIRFAIASSRDIRVPNVVFDVLKQRLSATEVVELAAVTAAYNMVARLLVVLEVNPEM